MLRRFGVIAALLLTAAALIRPPEAAAQTVLEPQVTLLDLVGDYSTAALGPVDRSTPQLSLGVTGHGRATLAWKRPHDPTIYLATYVAVQRMPDGGAILAGELPDTALGWFNGRRALAIQPDVNGGLMVLSANEAGEVDLVHHLGRRT
jgi:hypothetical protein